jgi:hypothetical protein
MKVAIVISGLPRKVEEGYNQFWKQIIEKYNAVINDMPFNDEAKSKNSVELSKSDEYLTKYNDSRKPNQDTIQTKIEELKKNTIIDGTPYDDTNTDNMYKIHIDNVATVKKIIEEIMSKFAALSVIDTNTEDPLVDKLAEIVEKIGGVFNADDLVSLYENELPLSDQYKDAITKILIKGMESIDDFQIRYTNTEAIEGNLIESIQNSDIFKTKMDVYYKMSLANL